MNIVTLIGRTTKDIELKITTSGKAVCSFTLAVNKDYKNADGTTDADFIDCVAFEGRAETISKYVHKGDKLAVTGRINTRTYTRQDGSNAKVFEVLVSGFEFLESKKDAPKEDVAPNFEEVADDDDLPF